MPPKKRIPHNIDRFDAAEFSKFDASRKFPFAIRGE